MVLKASKHQRAEKKGLYQGRKGLDLFSLQGGGERLRENLIVLYRHHNVDEVFGIKWHFWSSGERHHKNWKTGKLK